MPTVYGTTSPYSSPSRIQPYIEYTVTKQTGSFKINWEVGMYSYRISWGSSSGHVISCDGQSTSRTIAYSGGGNSSRSKIPGATGSFTISNPTGANKTVTLKYTKSGLNVSYNGNRITSLSVSAKITSNNTASASDCSAPTSISVSKTTGNPGSKVTLSWSGAKAGTANSITGYDIQKREYDGKAWGSWTSASPSSVSSTSTSSSASVTISSIPGNLTQFRVRTKGSAGSSYYSGWSSASSSVTSNVDTAVPPTVTLDRSWYFNSQYNQIKVTLTGGRGTQGNNMLGYELTANVDGTSNTSYISPNSISTTSSNITQTVTVSSVSSGYHTLNIAARTRGEANYSAWVYSDNQVEIFPEPYAMTPPDIDILNNSYYHISWTPPSGVISQNPIVGYKVYYSYTISGTNYEGFRLLQDDDIATELDLYDLIPDIKYTFYVSAIYQRTGESTKSTGSALADPISAISNSRIVFTANT